ncbi:GrpB family protein [Nocardiopsis sp. MG754419]|uniref:GrpB family protein n=1 Tax=Nocardiopsis sp. MG754419 TaxID=2259865 RepID=UPI0027DC8277|nr:GrpB family protein [Nocardiopsis sp. MG754419]
MEHVGSTSVPGPAAKPVIDVDLTVADPTDETAYVPALEAHGFVLTVREPVWHEHRMFRLAVPEVDPHVFGPDRPETIRHRLFRDRLIAHPEDLARYRDAELAAAAEVTERGGVVMDDNARKEPVLRDIYARMFAAHGLLRASDRSSYPE